MSAQSSKLPGAMITLAYLAAGLAISVSWAQLRQVLEMQAGLVGGEYIALAMPLAMPLALLFGGAVLWRMSGHLMKRSGVANLSGALCIVIFGAIFLESVSIFSSTISFNLGVNNRLQTDMEQSANYRAVTAANGAAAMAAQRLASDLQNMPENYRTESRKTANAGRYYRSATGAH